MRRGRTRAAAALGLLLTAVVVVAPPVAAQQDAADMVIRSLDFGGGAVAAGDSIDLTMEFVNRGPANVARGTRAVVNFNKSVTVTVVATNPAISCSGGGSLVCNAGNAGQGVRFNVRASVRVAPGASGNLNANGRVSSELPDPVPGNEERSATVPIASTANLTLTQSITPNPPQAGGNATVRPTVTNNGPSPADNVVVTVTIPAGVSLISASGGCSLGGGRLNCALGRIAPGASASAQIVYGLASLPAGSQVTAAATVRSSTPDPNGGNNAVAQTFTVGAATADVSIRKAATPNPATVGSTVTFTMVVSNAGPSDARGVVVTDALPAGLRLAGAQAPGSCSPLGRTVICNVGTLGAGASATVSISAVVLSSALPGPLQNTVTVQTETADRNPGNNAAAVALQVRGTTGTTRPTATTRPRTTVASTEANQTTTIAGELPATGGEGTPIGAASILLAAGVVFVAGAYRGRRS
jgi:uncharacterized repeat protein (TIGR01451 family)